MNLPVILTALGIWLFSDAWFSIVTYVGKPGQTILKDHSIRIIRGLIGVALVIIAVIEPN